MAASFQDFRSLIEQSPDAISVIDSEGEILYGSASTTTIFGYLPEELVGRNCLELIHPEDRDHSSWTLREVVAKPPGPLQWDARILHKNGGYPWVESTISNLLLEAEVRAIVVHQRNIDARKAVEEERKLHAEELQRSNARLEEFAYTAARNFRLHANDGGGHAHGCRGPANGEIHCGRRHANVHANRRSAFLCPNRRPRTA